MVLLLTALSAAAAALLLCAALGVIHGMLGYRRADVLTAAIYIGTVALCFLVDPLPKTLGKESLYLGLPAIAALVAYVALKLNERFKTSRPAMIIVPALAAILAPALYLTAHAWDFTDYQPPRHTRPSSGPLARALARAKNLKRPKN